MDYRQSATIAYTQFAYMFFKSMFQQEEYDSAPRYIKDILSVTLNEFAVASDSIEQSEFYEEFYTELTEGCYFVDHFSEEMSLMDRQNDASALLTGFLQKLYPGCQPMFWTVEFPDETNSMQLTFSKLHDFFQPMFFEVVQDLYNDEINEREIEREIERATEAGETSEETSEGRTPEPDLLTVLSRLKESHVFTTPEDLNFPLHYETDRPHNIYKQEVRIVDEQNIFLQLIRIPELPIDQSFFVTILIEDAESHRFRIAYVSEILKLRTTIQAEQLLERMIDSFDDLLNHSSRKNTFFMNDVFIKGVPDAPGFPNSF